MSISELFLIQRAISQIQIDEVLVRHTDFVGQSLEIGHSRFVYSHRIGCFSCPRYGLRVPFIFDKSYYALIRHLSWLSG